MPKTPGTPNYQNTFAHPFANSKKRLEIIRNDGIDVEEEARLYDEMCFEERIPRTRASLEYERPASLFSASESTSIWLGDNVGESLAFARDVKISGWTNVGDKDKLGGGAYVVYDCVVKTKEGTTIHAHKRYNAFVQLDNTLRRTLPRHQQRYVPPLPPKAPFSRYRPAFLDHRRRQLEYWLSAVLLHPDVGASKAVRYWIMN
ncbi:Phox homologous domain-containing protein [Lentinula raphanica]|uniref:Endosomal/vacuolar adapter protein YPT35 n=1 Tax=Lentinula raphanica TaxID=153919 RepID=A0AA38UF31_9AGAR|nr:Phox homologous domain-containing protein [Lentinula raphanica]KAJ3761285.1 Phox homologous domain-containing protein [Lentinula raphanica]KAJ3822297.1 Phox homologous domain-containing protein [Lentinula raphanica]KAJ3839174.1 Phox homologous domain-containing protein [Lentinula raphanica]KAJ3971051.1 Phox homologous domain-containing protein [Lentinula raphanica]